MPPHFFLRHGDPMKNSHQHIYSDFVSHDAAADMTTARCPCGDEVTFPTLAKNRISAWSAHGAGSVSLIADERRLTDDEWTIDETAR